MKVMVVEHDPEWADRFRSESALVARALGSNVVTIHHIGSTAIPTIRAKPIIDMLVEVAEIGEVDSRSTSMEALGYEAMGELGIPGRRYFRKNNEAGLRVYQAHTFEATSPQVERHLAFRDYMIAHPEDAQRYSELKQKLAVAHSEDIEGYMAGKDFFIKEMDKRAARWRAEGENR